MELTSYITLSDDVCRATNLTSRFDAGDLQRIGDHCWNGYQKDEWSRAPWLRRTQSAMDLAMQLSKDKSFPWPGASNVAFPLITIATLQFHARAYPEMFAGPEIVKYRVPGLDTTGNLIDHACRVARFMSHQCLDLDESFEEQHDRLLINVPIVGCAFVKTLHLPGSGNKSSLVLARDLVIDYYAKSVDGAARKTQLVEYSRRDIHSNCVSDKWRDVRKESWYERPFQPPSTPNRPEVDLVAGRTQQQADDDTPLLFGEQHCWLDLDGDGYAEPYIVTFDLVNKFVVRIVARWERPEDVERVRGEVLRIVATEYYTKYGLIPAPDGSIYDVGFGVLLGPLNESVNTLVNQLIDAGTMSVTAGGFLSRGVKIRGGAITFQPFGWQRVDSTGEDLSKGIFPYPVREPSAVLFNLLSLLINYTQRISGSGDTLVGENPGQNTPANNMNIMVEQGMKIYSAIFKRMWRSLRDEFRKLYILNARFLPDTVIFGDGKVGRQDFLEDPSKLVPVADPNVASDSQRLQRAMAIKQGSAGVPGYNPDEVERGWLRSMQVDNIEAIYPGIEATGLPKDPKLELEAAKTERRKMELAVEQEQFMATLLEERRLNNATILKLEADAQNAISEAAGSDVGEQAALLDAQIAAVNSRNEHISGMVDRMLKARELDLREKEIGVKEKEVAVKARKGNGGE